MLARGSHVHFMGIGGIGMSALAQILAQRGYRVTGCDVTASPLTERLIAQGIGVTLRHDPTHVDGVGALVYSSSITPQCPELVYARARRTLVLHRGQLLAELANQGASSVAVAGAHGKTTTTAMIATVLTTGGVLPTVLLGGELDGLGGNAREGGRDVYVVEADESDGSFLCLRPSHAVLTNVDEEHLNHYGSMARLLEACRRFLSQVAAGGTVVACADDARVMGLLPRAEARIWTYGFAPQATCRAISVECQGLTSRFTCLVRGAPVGDVELQVPGRHNITNALAAICVGLEFGLPVATIAEALADFRNVRRRFQLRPAGRGILVVEDYAHHPTEIAACVEAARGLRPARVVGVFQPHRYTRTQWLKERFVECLRVMDAVVVTETYAASEPVIAGATAQDVFEALRQAGHGDACFLDRAEIIPHLVATAREGDVILFLGAGDIGQLAGPCAEALSPAPSRRIAG